MSYPSTKAARAVQTDNANADLTVFGGAGYVSKPVVDVWDLRKNANVVS